MAKDAMPMADLTLRIAGEAGQGLVSVGEILSRAFVQCGLHVFTGQSYMSRIRGGLNWVDIRICDAELLCLREKADLLVAMSRTAVECLLPTLSTDATILHNCRDEPTSENVTCMDLPKIATEAGGGKNMVNSVAAGAIFSALDLDLDVLCAQIEEEFRNKPDDVGERNVACAKAGFEVMKEAGLSLSGPRPTTVPRTTLISGSQAIAQSAASAGVKLVAAYPMSPSTGTFAHLAELAGEYGIVVEQVEDEIAAINMICGASYAGVTSMATTSGGGFDLMVEGVSLAGMMEVPVIVLLAQRPGPATGLPTRTAQEDLDLAVHAGHGEFPKAVFAPGDHRQCYWLTRHAVFTSNKYHTPVIVLTDQYLQDAVKNIDPLDIKDGPVDRFIAQDVGESYGRYEVTADGISPRAIPGGEAMVVCDSDEHDAAGHINEDLRIRIEQQDKRMRKLQGMIQESIPPELDGPDGAEILLLCWGSSHGPVKEAVEMVNGAGNRSVAMLHFSQVWPLDIEKINERMEGFGRIIVVEGNYSGQFAGLLRRAGCTRDLQQVNRYDGLPLTPDFVLGKAEL